MTDTERDLVERGIWCQRDITGKLTPMLGEPPEITTLRTRVAELESSRFDVVTERNRFQTDNARLREALWSARDGLSPPHHLDEADNAKIFRDIDAALSADAPAQEGGSVILADHDRQEVADFLRSVEGSKEMTIAQIKAMRAAAGNLAQFLDDLALATPAQEGLIDTLRGAVARANHALGTMTEAYRRQSAEGEALLAAALGVAHEMIAEQEKGSPDAVWGRLPNWSSRLRAPIIDPKEAPAQEGWRDIESAPKDGTHILGFNAAEIPSAFEMWSARYYEKWPHQEGGPTYRRSWTTEANGGVFGCFPTHWMPLPPPPTTLEGE